MTIDDVIATIKTNKIDADIGMIRLAYSFAEEAHAGEKRLNGEPYIQHSLHTANILAELKLDETAIVAGLLHDIPENTSITLKDIEHNFGKSVASCVEGVTKLGKLKYRGLERYVESLRKMFIAMAKDIRVILVRFADRIHNLQTLDAQPKRKQQRIALESLEIYAPIANRLGMGEIKGRIEDLAFAYVNPKEYARVRTLQLKYASQTDKIIEQARRMLIREFRKRSLTFLDIHGRRKHLYSLYKKLQRKDNNITKVYDLNALRIIVRTIPDCYAVLGIVHELWKPLKGRIKDYVAQPKPNGYQSLHTTVFGPGGTIIELQIRTREMHDHAELGIAAHWQYDEGKRSKKARLGSEKYAWVKELANWKKETANDKEYLQALKLEMFRHHIFVFTPEGDVIELPEGSTPVDFAYAIHSEIGNHAVGAHVNEQRTKLDATLMSGDMVEVITEKGKKHPSRDWLRFVKTRKAKERIRQFAARQ